MVWRTFLKTCQSFSTRFRSEFWLDQFKAFRFLDFNHSGVALALCRLVALLNEKFHSNQEQVFVFCWGLWCGRGGSVVKVLLYWSEGRGFKSQCSQTSPLGPLNKTVNPVCQEHHIMTDLVLWPRLPNKLGYVKKRISLCCNVDVANKASSTLAYIFFLFILHL